MGVFIVKKNKKQNTIADENLSVDKRGNVIVTPADFLPHSLTNHLTLTWKVQTGEVKLLLVNHRGTLFQKKKVWMAVNCEGQISFEGAVCKTFSFKTFKDELQLSTECEELFWR